MLNEFIDDIAFDALVDSVGEAYQEDMGSNVGSTALLEQVMGDYLGDPEMKANFSVDLMQNEEMLNLGVLGDDFERLITSEEYAQISKVRMVELIS